MKACIFDLDDTLYKELDYVRSGISSVENLISELYHLDFTGKAMNAYMRGECDIWRWTCQELDIKEDCKEEFLWLYRSHNPDISLGPGIQDMLNEMERNDIRVAILTDGRSISQRKKVRSLGLQRFELYISDEWGSTKPAKTRFQAIQKKWGPGSYYYVGDNPSKDFVAPNLLGWTTIGAYWFKERVHPHQYPLEENQNPTLVVKSTNELLATLITERGQT